MSKLSELTHFFKSKFTDLGIKTEQFDAVMDKGKIEDAGGKETCLGIHVLDYSYTAIFMFEHMSAKHAGLLMVLVKTWLDNNDPDRYDMDLALPEIDIDTIDNDVEPQPCDVVLAVEFKDPVFIVQDENGVIEWYGKKYSFGDYDLMTAESFTLTEAVA